MRLILALQMSWCTRRRSSKPSLTSLTRRLQKCQATKLARNTARPSPALDLPPPNFTFSLHFRDRPPFSGKGEEECSVRSSYPPRYWNSSCRFRCLPFTYLNSCLIFPVWWNAYVAFLCVWLPTPICKDFLPTPTFNNHCQILWRLLLLSCFFQRILCLLEKILRVEHKCRA